MANREFRIKNGLIIDETSTNDGNITIANGKITTDANDGIITIKSTDTTDNLPIILALETGETAIIADEVLGKITFAAPDEASGTDAIVVSAAIQAVAEGTFSSSVNTTSLGFMTGISGVATQKMKLNSDGDLHLTTDAAQLHFGADSEVILRHVPDNGLLFLNNQAGGPVAIELTNSNVDASGSILKFNKSANAPAGNDKIGVIQFQASDGDNADLVYGAMRGIIADVNTTTDNLELGAVQTRVLTSIATSSRGMTDGWTVAGISTSYGEAAVRATVGGEQYGESYGDVLEKYPGLGGVTLFQWPTKKDFTLYDDGGGSGVQQLNQGALNIGGGYTPYTYESATTVSGSLSTFNYMANLWVNAAGYSEARITSVVSQAEGAAHTALGSALVLETISSQNKAGVYFTRNRNHTSFSFADSDTSESLTDITWGSGLAFHASDNSALSRDFIIGYYANDYDAIMAGDNHPLLDAQAHVRITASSGHLTLEKDNAELRLSDGAYITGFKAHATMTASAIYTLPAADGDNGDILSTNSSGALSWTSAGSAAAITGTATGADNRVATYTATAALAGEANLTFDAPLLTVTDTTGSSATQGGKLRLASNDSAVMGNNDRLGVIEFAGAEDTSSTISVGARIQAITRDAWDGSNNDADLQFYTTDGTTESLVLTLDADNLATFAGNVTMGNTLTYGNGATIVNTSTALLTITEATTTFSGIVTAGGTITAVGSFIIGSADMSEADLEKLDGITNGTAAASKAVVLDGSKNIATIGTVGCGAITSTGSSSLGATTLASLTCTAAATFGGGYGSSGTTITTAGVITSNGACTIGGILKTDDTTAATSITDGSLQTDGGLSVTFDAVIGDDLILISDSSVIHFGVDKDITLTHTADTGLTLSGAHANGTNLQIDNTVTDGDSAIQFALSGAVKYTMGVEDGDDDKFVINYGTGVLGAAPALEIDSSGNMTILGNLTVSGTTTTVDSTTVTVDDPIFTIGGDTAPGSADAKDRGIEFRYFLSGDAARIGFFGFDNSTQSLTGFTAATNSSEIFSGTLMPVVFGAGTFSGHVLPGTDDSYDLGSASAAWQDLFLEGDITMTDAGSITTSAGGLTITPAAASTWSTGAGALTLTSAAAATWSTAAGALTLTSAAAATWSTTAGILTLDGDDGIQISSTGTGNIDLDSIADIVLDVGAGQVLHYQEAGTTYAIQDHANVTVAQSSGVAVDTFLCTTYQATKYLILVTDVDNSNFMACELLVLGDDTDDEAYLTQYAVVYNDTTDKDLGVFTATESSSTITLTYTANNTAGSSSTGHKIRAVATRIAAH